MANLHRKRASPLVAKGRNCSTASGGKEAGRPTDRGPGVEYVPRTKSGATQRIMVAISVILAMTVAPADPSKATEHEGVRPLEGWPQTSAVLREPGTSVVEIVDAAKLDLAQQGAYIDTPAVEFARWLHLAMSDAEIHLEAKRSVEILKCFMAEPGQDEMTFWGEFSLAVFHQMARDDVATAHTLARALKLADSEDVPSEIVAKTKGIMGHAQQASGMLDQARQTFDALKTNPVERAHASVHLGEIALFTDGVSAGVRIWLNHPDGAAVAVAVIADEADALWVSDPEQSYRLAAEALARFDQESETTSAGLEMALARLKARSRDNAMRP